MLKKGLAILLTAVTILTSGVVAQPVSVQARAKTESNSGATNLKECLERTDMNVIHSLETNKGWRDESIQYVKGLKYNSKCQIKGYSNITEKKGWFDITNPTIEVASKIARRIAHNGSSCLYAKSGVFDSNFKKICYLMSQVGNDGVSFSLFFDDYFKESFSSYDYFKESFDRHEYTYIKLDVSMITAYRFIRCLAGVFQDNGVDLMSLSELARYEIVSELIESNMIHDDKIDYSSFGVEQAMLKNFPLEDDRWKSNDFFRLYRFYTEKPELKYLNHGSCSDYANLKVILARYLGLNAHMVVGSHHAWVIASVKNSTGKQMTIVDDYGVLTGYGWQRNDLKSDGLSVVGTYENGLSLIENSSKRELKDMYLPKSNYALSDYDDVFKIRTCGILDAAWQKCVVERKREIYQQDYVNNLDKNSPANMFMDENGHYHYRYTDVYDDNGNLVDSIEDPNYLAEWAAYVDYMQSKNN